MQGLLWAVIALCLGVAVLATFAERRRARREGMDRIGWVPWSAIIVAALFAAVAALAVALHR